MSHVVVLEVAYNCAYCGGPMYHREDFQPSISYAECWTCWSKKVLAQRDRLRRQVDDMAKVLIGISALTVISGLVWMAT